LNGLKKQDILVFPHETLKMDPAVYDPVIAIPECECGLNFKKKILADLTDEGTLI
jgi:hypothetical protein